VEGWEPIYNDPTIWLEHKAMDLFKGKTGGWNTFLKYFLAWLILFGSKFVILEALSQVFGTKVHFGGMWHGVIALIVVVVVMLVAEELMVRVYRKLAEKTASRYRIAGASLNNFAVKPAVKNDSQKKNAIRAAIAVSRKTPTSCGRKLYSASSPRPRVR
jgi:hypothetical protein